MLTPGSLKQQVEEFYIPLLFVLSSWLQCHVDKAYIFSLQ